MEATLPGGLAELADHYGIAREFWDWKGRHVVISAETITAVLAALDVDASTPAARERALAALHETYWLRVLPACTVVQSGERARIPVHVPAGSAIELTVVLESGERRPLAQGNNEVADVSVAGFPRGEATFLLPDDLPLGYHSILAAGAEGKTSGALIVTPRVVGYPAAMGQKRIWGYGLQLYSVTSYRSWGMGDLTDLADLITWSGTQQGADYALINPVHAAEAAAPVEPSPYLPTSRRFLNPAYIRPESVPEYALLGREDRERIRDLRRGVPQPAERIDRDASWRAKRAALRLVHAIGRRTARQIALAAFRDRGGRALRGFATWSALSEEYGNDWRAWPTGLQRPESPEVRAFVAAHLDTVEFHEWLQWIAQTQLSAAQTAAEEAGMAVGVVTDLTVGVSPRGFETWMMPDLFAAGIHVGAPPDQYNQAGQDWGQPPWRPDRLAEQAYAPFRAMVRAAMHRVGGVRIDHIIGLFRLWWVPQGLGPRHGTYVRNDHQALVGIVALEAHRAQALVVGEDLGTVEPWAREYLAERGILGTSVLWFETDEHGDPLDAAAWREACMASVTTHDLPPSAGYLAGDHVRLRDELGLLTEPLEDELQSAHDERARWMNLLIERGLLRAGDAEDPEEIVLALHRFIRSTPSRMLQASLADAVGERRTQNQPGTHAEYPNWRIPLADATGARIPLEKVFAAQGPCRVAAALNGDEPHRQG